MPRPRLLLATSSGYADGEPGHEALDAALAAAGVDSTWAVWDDPTVDWGAADLVAVRSTWDYDLRLAEFLRWARSVGPHLLHGADLFAWNTDKSYLVDLATHTGVPVVPTVLVDTPGDLPPTIDRFGTAVVKPRVGAGGRGIAVVRDAAWRPVEPGPWVVQPLVTSVHDEGETSVFVLDGHPATQVSKVAGAGDIRVNEEHGGTVSAAALTDEAALLAADVVAATAELTGADIVYARVDLLRHEGRLVVSEVEVTEPGLYLDVVPGNGERFVRALLARL